MNPPEEMIRMDIEIEQKTSRSQERVSQFEAVMQDMQTFFTSIQALKVPESPKKP